MPTNEKQVPLDEANTPLRPLLSRIGGAARWLAPERAEEIQQLAHDDGTNYPLRLGIYQGEDYHFDIGTMYGLVRMNVDALERIWAYAYAYLCLLHYRQQNPVYGQEQDLRQVPELDTARALLSWATLNWQNRDQRVPWPEGLPQPDRDDGTDANLEPANVLFLAMMAFVILHEAGHLVGRHTQTETTQGPIDGSGPFATEYAADEYACGLLLDRWREDPRPHMFEQRAIAIVLSLGLQAALEPYSTAGLGEREHPCTPDRLLNFWHRFVERENDAETPKRLIAEAISMVIMSHLYNAAFRLQNPAHRFTDVPDFLRQVRPYFQCQGDPPA